MVDKRKFAGVEVDVAANVRYSIVAVVVVGVVAIVTTASKRLPASCFQDKIMTRTIRKRRKGSESKESDEEGFKKHRVQGRNSAFVN